MIAKDLTKNSLTKIEQKIERMMKGNYEPSLKDSIRIYKEYRNNKEEISAILSDVYKWLAQEPLHMNYKQGEIFMRCEIINSEEVFCIHYIYINQNNTIAIENYLSHEEYDITENTIKELAILVKNDISNEVNVLGRI